MTVIVIMINADNGDTDGWQGECSAAPGEINADTDGSVLLKVLDSLGVAPGHCRCSELASPLELPLGLLLLPSRLEPTAVVAVVVKHSHRGGLENVLIESFRERSD